MRASFSPAVAANRYGLGARPGDLPAIGADPRGWLIGQLAGAPPRLDTPRLRSSAEILAAAMRIRGERRALQRAARTSDAAAVQLGAAQKVVQLYRPIYRAETTARLRAAIETDRPFLERLVHFWTNHFAVSVDKLAVLGLAGPAWRETAIVLVTEFGRTVAVNGTRGTDHGTATAVLLLGGAIRGGRVVANWPGLAARALYEGRDLAPTLDLRSVLKGLLHEQLGVSPRALEDSVFPQSAQAPALRDLLRA